MSESNTMRVYVKNTAKSEELFNHVFGKLSGKTLSTYLSGRTVYGDRCPSADANYVYCHWRR